MIDLLKNFHYNIDLNEGKLTYLNWIEIDIFDFLKDRKIPQSLFLSKFGKENKENILNYLINLDLERYIKGKTK